MAGLASLGKWFDALSVRAQSCVIVAAAVVGADLLTLLFYSIFFFDRLLLDLALTSLIVVVIGFPLAYLFMTRSARIADLAARLESANRIDDLTDLLNRKTFLKSARDLVAAAPDGEGAGAMLFIDADHFKTVNDTFGHAVGDSVLREIGAVLQSAVEPGDLVGRLGGEEFAVFLAGAKSDRLETVCDRIQSGARRISRVLELNGSTITVSIGAMLHAPGQDLDSLLVAADRNLYAAKKDGRDRIVRTGREMIAA